MNSLLSKGLIFVAGLAIGATVGVVAANKILKKKYQQDIRDELATLQEDYTNLMSIMNSEASASKEDDISVPESHATRMNYLNEEFKKARDLVQEVGYDVYSSIYPIDDDESRPQVIPPDECGDIDEYEICTFFYTSDKILTDDTGEPIEDIENTVGSGSLDTFGDYEDDSVYVRNDRLRTYFEILLDPRTQSEIMGDK